MKKNFNQIDEAFREKLFDFESAAPGDVWSNIEQKLNKSRQKPFAFFKIAAAIAAIMVISSTLFFYNKNSKEIQQNNYSQNIPAENKISNNKVQPVNKINLRENKNIKPENIEIKANRASTNNVTKNTFKNLAVKTNIKKTNLKNTETIKKIKGYLTLIDIQKNEPQLIQVEKKDEQIDIHKIEDTNILLALNTKENKKDKKGRWSVGGEFSPLYSYRYLTNTSAQQRSYYNEVESPLVSFAGGLNVQYKVYERLTIQTGLYYASMGQSIEDISVYANGVYEMIDDEYKQSYMNSYSVRNSTGNIAINSPYVLIDDKLARVDNQNWIKGVYDINDPVFSNINAEIQQKFRYLEIPLVARYKFIDKKLDFNIIGGLGASFLIGNDVYLIYGDNKEIIGETKEINYVNYSGSLGIGIDYPLLRNINIRLEPTIKYYLSVLNTNSSIQSHPYSFGLYTGISYSF